LQLKGTQHAQINEPEDKTEVAVQTVVAGPVVAGPRPIRNKRGIHVPRGNRICKICLHVRESANHILSHPRLYSPGWAARRGHHVAVRRKMRCIRFKVIRNIYKKVKKNIHKILSPASVDKSVHKIASPSKYRTFLCDQTLFA